MYISFEELDNYLKNHPLQADMWIELTNSEKERYHNYIHLLIDGHRWKGVPLESPMQRIAFPRIIEDVLVRWQSDPEVLNNHPQWQGSEQILPVSIITESVVYLLGINEIKELILQRDEGIKKIEIDVIKTEFQASFIKVPLPVPMWHSMKYYSLEYNETSRFFRVERA